ncbi:daunorubicin resistance protein DrrA family ABC transporter ATP-binding protein [Evansella cellulosilytica]|uniref:Daunorubicin resistance ABC transporter ATPase subunit n=1 Tax=Evansella cellulosilytica (strain ATCC 21833 / DSM 2522 / FERM P-1141 / JCM 9156 / N-4) TaxID=649639 RepID=E6TZC0_EVAC2|nr:daunorubicin resistance protein DrrA family ABC transporter ATP-binding protein [Evansella cellulosilytica]ADU28982.1 daunorubicin resistance ABC transporter ATPase subunit [Evansella cellulosilytica DSM 2522]
MLETEELRKVFKGKTAVDGVNLYMDKGESIGLLGPNGAGKSTTISMISSLVKPTSGDVRLHEKSVIKEPSRIRRVLGVVPQEIALYEELTAYENLKFFGRIYGLKSKSLEKKIEEVLYLVGLEERKDDIIKTYSGGMQRRINIAAAMLHDPEILIMDEPTVGIDPQSRSHILDMVRDLNQKKGMTVLYTSHYMEEVERLCDRVYIMDHGRVIASGTKDELKSILSGEETILIDFDRQYKALFLELQSHHSILQAIETDKGIKLIVPKGSNLLSTIFQIAEKHQAKILNVNVQVPTLEDVFLHLTGRKLRD